MIRVAVPKHKDTSPWTEFRQRRSGLPAHTAQMPNQARIALVCPKCGRSGEATISEDVGLSAGHPDFLVHTISPEFRVIGPYINWNRIMIRCICEGMFSVIRRPRSAT